MILAAVSLAAEFAVLPAPVDVFAMHFSAILLIALVIWLLTRAVCALSDIVLLRFEVDVRDNLRARRVHTQVNMLRRIVIVAILAAAGFVFFRYLEREGDDEPATRDFRLSGFFSRPQVQKANRNSIYIFVNRRLIRDRVVPTISAKVS